MESFSSSHFTHFLPALLFLSFSLCFLSLGLCFRSSGGEEGSPQSGLLSTVQRGPPPHGKNAEDILLRIEVGKTSPSDGINNRREEEKGEEELTVRESDAV